MLYIGKKFKKGEKRMNKLTRKLITSIMTLAFAFIALGTTTFAWFTLSNTVEVGQFEAKVTAGSGFEVSVDDGINGYEPAHTPNYYTSVPSTVTKNALIKAGYESDFRLLDLTSPDGKTFNSLSSTGVNSGYIKLQLKFRSPVASTKIYLGSGTGFDISQSVEQGAVNPGITWVSDASFTNAKGVAVAEGTSTKYFAADAARISFSDDDATAPTMVIYEAPTSDTNTVLDNTPIENGSVNYYFVKTGENPTGFATTTIPSSITAGLEVVPEEGENLPLVLTLSADVAEDGFYYGILNVRVWIEGWDPDCFNSILNDILRVNLHFITKE